MSANVVVILEKALGHDDREHRPIVGMPGVVQLCPLRLGQQALTERHCR